MTDAVGDVDEWIRACRQSANGSGQRHLLILGGSSDWHRQRLNHFELPEQDRVLCVSAQTLIDGVERCLPASVDHFAGQEFDLIVYDTASGFYPDAIGQAEGTLKGGGVLVLLTPLLDQWPAADDRFNQDYGIHQQADSCFVRRFIALAQQHPAVSVVQQQQALPDAIAPANEMHEPAALQDEFLQEQSQAIEQVRHVADGHRNRPLMLLSDRGRGKSSLMGIAAAQLLRQGHRTIIATAPRRACVKQLFLHARRELDLPVSAEVDTIEYEQSEIRFVAPDELIRNPYECDLLLVDEAASIPYPLLDQLLRQYHRVVFATTVYGYEGSGRGFELRFTALLNQLRPGWQQCRLQQPVRWQRQDPLEQFFYQAFLYGSTQTTERVETQTDDIVFSVIDRKDLCHDSDTLAMLFDLLREAHYRTTPNDIRMILDHPGIRIHVGCIEHRIVAVLLLMREVPLDAGLAQQISLGERRPHGNLLSQSLLSDFRWQCDTPCWRIMRIAVHPDWQGNGYGTRLLADVEQHLLAQPTIIGASFSANADIMSWWIKRGYRPVRVGASRSAYTGEYAAIVIKSLSSRAEPAVSAIGQQFAQRFLFQLSDTHRELEPGLAHLILLAIANDLPPCLERVDMDVIHAFARHHASYASSSATLYDFLLQCLKTGASQQLPTQQLHLLIMRLVQRRTPEAIIRQTGSKGKKDLLRKLREAVSGLLSATS